MKKVVLILALLITAAMAKADSHGYCSAMNGKDNIAKCYQIAALANQDVVRMITLLQDDVYEKMALEAVETRPTEILSVDVSICVWQLRQNNDGLVIRCLENLKNQKDSFFNQGVSK